MFRTISSTREEATRLYTVHRVWYSSAMDTATYLPDTLPNGDKSARTGGGCTTCSGNHYNAECWRTYTPQQIAAAAALQACINHRIELADIPGMCCPETGYPISPEYAKRAAVFSAVEKTTLDALGITDKDAAAVRWQIAFEFKGTRNERVAVMGEHWVKNQEDRGIVPTHDARGA